MKRKMPKRAWASGRGALTFVALVLIGSALLRLSGTGAAIALELKEQIQANTSDEHVVDTEVKDLAPDLIKLLAETKEREERVADREAELEARIQALTLIEGAVAKDLKRLEVAEETLRATMAQADKAAETDIGQLTAVYENMKPEQAAALFERMEPSFAAGFLGRMRSDSAAAILAGLDPDLAYSISVVLAGRNADVPREIVPDPSEPSVKQ
jgi:flagellar motility protein MotE (MotC chaperone)